MCADGEAMRSLEILLESWQCGFRYKSMPEVLELLIDVSLYIHLTVGFSIWLDFV